MSEEAERTPDEWRRATEEARIERLTLAIGDMDDAAAAARWLLATHHEVRQRENPFDDLRLRVVLEAGMIVSYARAFNESRGDPPLPAAPTSGLSAEQRRIHQWARDRRDQVAAHVDRGAEERVVIGTPVTVTIEETGETFVLAAGEGERYRPATPDQLRELAELAEHLAARYRAERFGTTSQAAER